MKTKLWGGRFKKPIDPDFERLSSSLKWDRRLLPYDLKINAAHIRALAKCKVLKNTEAKRLLSALVTLERRYRAGKLAIHENAEDIHSAIQEELKKIVGDLADKIH